jgi:hypothetical protein
VWKKTYSYNNISVSFIGGENWSTRRKPLTCGKSLKLYHIMLYRVHLRKNVYRKCNFSRKIKICSSVQHPVREWLLISFLDDCLYIAVLDSSCKTEQNMWKYQIYIGSYPLLKWTHFLFLTKKGNIRPSKKVLAIIRSFKYPVYQ